MMLRKMNRNAQNDRSSTRKTSLFDMPGLFVGFNNKSSSDSDSAKSPTSPLDIKLFNLSSPFVRSPPVDGPRRSWDCDRVGLGLADVLLDRSSSSGILLGNQIRIDLSSPKIFPISPPKSPEIAENLPCLELGSAETAEDLPCLELCSSETEEDRSYFELGSSESLLGGTRDRLETGELGKIRSCFADFGESSLLVGGCVYRGSKSSEVLVVEPAVRDVTPGKLMGSPSASEIEESEDYTRITTHGPNPKTTHIFGNRILDCHPSELLDLNGKTENGKGPSSWFVVRYPEDIAMPSFAEDFLSSCYNCKKKLEECDDIYMYRGEKAFCSCECRELVISADEREAKAKNKSSKPPTSADKVMVVPAT